MITNGFTYLAVLILFASIVIYGEKKSNSKFFNFVPAIVIIYFGAMLMSTFHIWELNDGVLAARGAVKTNLLPAMIFLMLLRCDLRDIAKLGPKMILTFIAATASFRFRGFRYGIFFINRFNRLFNVDNVLISFSSFCK